MLNRPKNWKEAKFLIKVIVSGWYILDGSASMMMSVLVDKNEFSIRDIPGFEQIPGKFKKYKGQDAELACDETIIKDCADI
ncbi:MAG: hypothetical protein HFH67_01390 [Lachnospiraceae bacterium]|nr:hypothetical protein [Lachnospiraceae bacterium]